MPKKRTTRRSGKSRRVRSNLGFLSAAGDRAYYDALHQHFLDLAYERLKDPEYREMLLDFLEKSYLFLARKARESRAKARKP
jgi:hypothetical protein